MDGILQGIKYKQSDFLFKGNTSLDSFELQELFNQIETAEKFQADSLIRISNIESELIDVKTNLERKNLIFDNLVKLMEINFKGIDFKELKRDWKDENIQLKSNLKTIDDEIENINFKEFETINDGLFC